MQGLVWMKEADPTQIPQDISLLADEHWYAHNMEVVMDDGLRIETGDEEIMVILNPGKTFSMQDMSDCHLC
jgi:hypothetical protein